MPGARPRCNQRVVDGGSGQATPPCGCCGLPGQPPAAGWGWDGRAAVGVGARSSGGGGAGLATIFGLGLGFGFGSSGWATTGAGSVVG